MRNHIGWLAAILLAAPLHTVAAEDAASGPVAPNTASATPACGGCKLQNKGGPKDAAATAPGRTPGMPMMKRSEAVAEQPHCKQRDTNCRLDELQRANQALEQRLDMMQKRMDAMARRGDAAGGVAPESGGEPAPEPHHH